MSDSKYPHTWERDGERCVVCGDKDWMGGSCRPPTPDELAALRAQVAALEKELEQTRVQLAGCGVAALGYDQGCKEGDYGWSASFGDVMELRTKADAWRKDRDRLLALLREAREYISGDSDRLGWVELLDEIDKELGQ